MSNNTIELVKKIYNKRGFNKISFDKLESSYKDAFKDVDENTSLDIELQWLANRCGSFVTVHPQWALFGAAILNKKMKRKRLVNYLDFLDDLQEKSGNKILSNSFLQKIYGFSHLLSKIDHERNQLFDFFGYTTLTKGYLLKHEDLYESPQEMYMRVAIFLGNTEEEILEIYDILSLHYATFATPTMMNAGLEKGQLASCFLIQNYDDSIEGLMDVCKDSAIISKNIGGIGIAISNVRAKGTGIGNKGISGGLMPMLKTHNDLMKWFNQLGKRPGAMAEYLETWHKDIIDFLNIRRPSGKEEMRARDLFTALWVSDLFMERVQNDKKWTLFCPNEIKKSGIKPLYDCYGSEFVKNYEHLEELYKQGLIDGEEIQAREIWIAMITSQIETGTPYLLFKDRINHLSMHNNLGVVKSSNLCAEIVEYTDENTIADCNLASINASKFVENKIFNYVAFSRIVKNMVKYLDRIIDLNTYPVEKSIESNKTTRPIGLGIQGFADAIALLDYSFEDDERSLLFNKQLFEIMQYCALEMSVDLAKEFGRYDRFSGSDYEKGIFHFEKAGVKVEDLLHKDAWEDLREKIKKDGVRNSLLIALMPTAGTSQIMGGNECFEPFTSNVYTRNVGSSNFIVINKHLVHELEEIGAWNEGVSNWLIMNNGSVNGLVGFLWDNNFRTSDWERIEFIEKKYRNAFEISNKTIIHMAAERTPFVCQSQSMNLFMDSPTPSKVSSMLLYSWKSGVKTGMYYLRTKPYKSANAKLGMDNVMVNTKPLFGEEVEFKTCSMDDPDCIACSA